VHAGVLDSLGAVPADLSRRVLIEELAVGFVEVGDDPIGVGHHGAVVNALEDELEHLELALERFSVFRLGGI
jgi:hypothetical protein